MLMFDKIDQISETDGPDGKGLVRAVFDISADQWFFACHFKNDPVMPGCLGLDALWQLLGFYLGWLGLPGRGRALGVGEVKLAGQVLPDGQADRLRGRSSSACSIESSCSAWRTAGWKPTANAYTKPRT